MPSYRAVELRSKAGSTAIAACTAARSRLKVIDCFVVLLKRMCSVSVMLFKLVARSLKRELTSAISSSYMDPE